jgi:hypothetical protein
LGFIGILAAGDANGNDVIDDTKLLFLICPVRVDYIPLCFMLQGSFLWSAEYLQGGDPVAGT